MRLLPALPRLSQFSIIGEFISVSDFFCCRRDKITISRDRLSEREHNLQGCVSPDGYITHIYPSFHVFKVIVTSSVHREIIYKYFDKKSLYHMHYAEMITSTFLFYRASLWYRNRVHNICAVYFFLSLATMELLQPVSKKSL